RRLNFLGEPEPYEPVRPRDPWQPTHLVIVRDGHYVTLGRTGLLSKHHSDTGELLWSHQVSDPDWERADLLGRPAEAPDGTLYVPHGGLGAVLAVGADGAPTGEFGASGTKRGELAFPVAVAVGTGGNVLVLDRVRHAVLVYGPDRRYRTEFGHVGYSPGDFYHPLGLAAAADGRTWVAQGFEGRVQQFRLQLAD
ncbi:MAG TPA: hypothetical protein VKU85_02710, partial [bacterium]|nr:hypothetical protein [bacterium]